MNDNLSASNQADSEAVETAARQWFVCLRNEPDPETKMQFDAWLAAAPAHAASYAMTERIFREAEILKGSARFGRHRAMPSPTSRQAKFWIGGIIAMAATLIMTLMPHGRPDTPTTPNILAQQGTSLSTKRGEIRSIGLADGSRVTLDTDSRILVSINRQERHLELVQGHARLAVARDPRPFRVDAGAGTIAAKLGTDTSFDIAYDDGNHVEVTMISGRAEARPRLQTAVWRVPVATLDSGQGVGWSDAGFASFAPTEAARRIDNGQWPSGWVSYNSVALGTLVSQANRYADRPIVIDSPDVNTMSITGRFHISAPAPLAGRLAEVFGLKLVQTTDAIHLRSK